MTAVLTTVWALAALFVLNSVLITARTHHNAGTTAMWVISTALVAYGLFWEPINRFGATGPGRVLFILLAMFCAAYIAMAVFLGIAVHARPPHGDEKALLVLGAGLRGEQVSDLLRRRLTAALAAHKKNPGAFILVCGGQSEREVIPEAVAMARWLLAHGASEDKIILEDKSLTTRQNLEFAKALLARRGIGLDAAVAIVTNTFHCYRAGYSARKCGYTNARLLPASMNATTFLQNYLREVMALGKTWISGDIKTE